MSLIDKVISKLWTPVVGLMFGIALAFFIWGVIEFMFGAESEEKREAGKRHLIYGLIGLFIMVAVWAIVGVINRFVQF